MPAQRSCKYASSSCVSSRHAPLFEFGVERHIADGDALKAADLKADLFTHPADLAVAALMDGHADFGAVLAALHDNDARRTDGVAVELHRLGKARDIVHIAAHADLIVLFDLVARMGQAVDQIAVVGQQQQALGL